MASSLLWKFIQFHRQHHKNSDQVRMSNEKTRLFLPLACCAIFSAATFGGIGVAALTGQIAVAAKKGDFFPRGNDFRQRKSISDKPVASAVTTPTHVGLTRSALRNAGDNDKPMVMRVSQRFSQTLAPPCSRCGVIDSIERHELQMPVEHSASGRLEFAESRSNNKGSSFPASILAKTSKRSAFSGNDQQLAISFIVRLRMEDGSLRTIYEHQPPEFSVGERVQLVNGSVVSLS